MNHFTTSAPSPTPEALAADIISRANACLAQTTPYMMPFGKTERDAPMLHALIQAVAEEILALNSRVGRLENLMRRAEAGRL